MVRDSKNKRRAAEPETLLQGKQFHRRIQKDWEENAKDGDVTVEHTVPLRSAFFRGRRTRHGRIDIFVDDIGDFVSVVEIKATDWDRIKNCRKLLASHCRQVWRYIEKYIDGEKIDVCAGIIYPREPVTPGLREEVEKYLNDYGLQVVWYEDHR